MGTFTTNDGVELTYQGSGPVGGGVPLVMLHGWGQTQATFRDQLTRLAPRRRVVTMDQHGQSAKPHHGYRIARLARDAEQLLDHLGIDQADVLGWSMGVSVWWSFVDQNGTGRIRRFVAVDQPTAVAAVPRMAAMERSTRVRSSTSGRMIRSAARLELWDADPLPGPGEWDQVSEVACESSSGVASGAALGVAGSSVVAASSVGVVTDMATHALSVSAAARVGNTLRRPPIGMRDVSRTRLSQQLSTPTTATPTQLRV